MRRRSTAGRKPIKPQRRKATGKRRAASRASRDQNSSVAALRTQIALLTRERDEALERQNATGEILASITGSTTDLSPVFEAIVRNLLRLFGTRFAIVTLVRDGMLVLAGFEGEPGFEKFADNFPVRLDEHTFAGKALLAGRAIQLTPVIGNPESPPFAVSSARKFGFNSQLAAPMLREGRVIGAIVTAHRDATPFNDKQLALIKSFAAQAVIAIENTRLLSELRESLEQQTATADVLRVISTSPGDLEPVFQSMLANAVRICDAAAGNVYRWDGEELRLVTAHNTPPAFVELIKRTPQRASTDNIVGRMLATKSLIHTADASAQQVYLQRSEPLTVAAVELGGVRTLLVVPMFKDDELVGAFTVFRSEVRPFSDKQIALVQNFAAQAKHCHRELAAAE